MKIKVTTFIKPMHWDCKPDEVLIYDLTNEMQRRFYLRDMAAIDLNEVKIVEEYREEKENGL